MMRLTRSKSDGGLIYTMDRSDLEERISYGHWRPRRKKAPLQVAMSRLVPALPLPSGTNIKSTSHQRGGRRRKTGMWTAWKSAHGSRVFIMTHYLFELMDALVGPDRYDRADLAQKFEQMCFDTFDRRALVDLLSADTH